MKKNKILKTILGVCCPIITISPIISVTSCNSNEFFFDSYFIVDCINEAANVKDKPTQINVDFFHYFSSLSKQDQYKELAYDLFVGFLTTRNINNPTNATEKISLLDLYVANFISIGSNISKYDVAIDQTNKKINYSFLGGLKCVVIKEFNDYKVGDYIMFTFTFSNLPLNIVENNKEVSLKFGYDDTIMPRPQICFVDNNGKATFPIFMINTELLNNEMPKNQKNIKLT